MRARRGAEVVSRERVVRTMVLSGIELAIYIGAPIYIGYLIGQSFGKLGMLLGIVCGAVFGLLLASLRALRMEFK